MVHLGLSEEKTFAQIALKLGDRELPVQKSAPDAYTFIIPEDVNPGQYELSIITEAGTQKFESEVVAIPSGITLASFLNGYESAFLGHLTAAQNHIKSIDKVMDSFAPRPQIVMPGPFQDSITYFTNQLTQLPVETQEVIFKVIYSQLKDMSQVREISERLLQTRIESLSQFKRSGCSSEWEAQCLLQDARIVIATLKAKLIANSIKSAIGGVGAGLIAAGLVKKSHTAWVIGEKVTIGLLAYLTFRDVLNAYSELEYSTLSYLVSVVDTWFPSQKAALQFTNETATSTPFRIYRKNLAGTDRKFNVYWITGFLTSFDSFRQKWMELMPDNCGITPDYAMELRLRQKVKKSEYLSVVEISNPVVKLIKSDLVNGQPVLTFSGAGTSQISFTFKYQYDDGAFKQVSNPVSALLNPKPAVYYRLVNFETTADSLRTYIPVFVNDTMIAYISPGLSKSVGGGGSSIWNEASMDPRFSSFAIMQFVQATPGGNPSDLISKLNPGAIIGPGSTFGNGLVISSYSKDGNASPKITGSTGDEIYFGFRINNFLLMPDRTFYGWMKLSISPNSGYLKLHDFAVSTQAGTPIAVGQTN
ncbi:hypothetical protein MASR2M44_21250 [Bacteroidota bacterium]